MKDFMSNHFDKLIVIACIAGFMALLPVFPSGDSSKFLEQSISMALGCLLGLVKNSTEKN